MKKLFKVTAIAFMGFGLFGCGSDKCASLQAQCDACNGSAGKEACQKLVDDASDNACSLALDLNIYTSDTVLCNTD